MKDPNQHNPENFGEEDFSEMVKEYDLKNLSVHSPIEGRIIDINKDRVIIDIGQKTEGMLKLEEIVDWEGNCSYKPGDAITVLPVSWNVREGYIEVSKKQLDVTEGWDRVVRAYKRNAPLQGRISKLLPEDKGYIVDMGVEMFLPMSQANATKVKKPQQLVGKEFTFRITKLNKKEMSGAVSRRVLLEEEKKEKVKLVFETLKTGQLVTGMVTSIQDYGVFVDLGGVEGLLHKENISYSRLTHPREKVKIGDEIEVKILDMDPEKGKISLGLKQKFPDPWENIEEKYPVGKRLIAKVTKIVSFGAFIELEEGVEGLLHISDLTWEGRPSTVEEYVAVGDKLWVQVIEINREAKKLKLGLKQLEMRPEEKYIQNHRVGEVIHVKVKKILKSRVFVGIQDDVEGVIKISDISYARIETPEEYLEEGEEVDAVIISEEVDRNFKVQLGLKQLSDTEWHAFFKQNKPGNVVPVTLKKVTDKGIVAEVTKHIEGFIRLGDIEEERVTAEEIMAKYKPGDKKEALIIRFEPDKRKIYLSLRALDKLREKEELEKYMKSEDDSVTTVGDLLQNELDKLK